MLMEGRLVGWRVVHLGCRVVPFLNHLNRKRPLWSSSRREGREAIFCSVLCERR